MGYEFFLDVLFSDECKSSFFLITNSLHSPATLEEPVLFLEELKFPDDLREGLSEREHQIVKRIIRNLKIRVNHRAEARTSSKIERLTQTPASSKS
ncbi:Piwi domain-containing protein [Rhizophagus irregularis DAOM 181602=DAOM 197198]|uniref:Uncharacterized protein n=1 Tax=Rhizophagus irregularis TaxID=588596 RepID=A0A2N1P1S4_9GLOM|nr:hypothetical protein RhiirC2_768443 [Rhizophagus irregularis]GET49947.1 Piwi domain-containing protein [Rhizophagus irregularis DAOM 181602=DAOM 197198]